MSGARRTRAALAQNLFRSDGPARRLVRIAGVQPGQVVYDLGAGTGRVTSALLDAGARVTAVERDPNLAAKLRARFAGRDVRALTGDLVRTDFRAPFSVVANLPFNVTAETLRRLTTLSPAPDRITLVLQREAARKWAGLPRPTVVSLGAAPWFEVEVSSPFARQDFVPAPACEVAVLHAARRAQPLLPVSDRPAWEAFLRYALARPQPDARRVFRNLLSNLQWRRLSAEVGIEGQAARDGLEVRQWIAIFRFVQRHVPAGKVRAIHLPRDQ